MKKTFPLYVVPHSHFDVIWRRPMAWYRRRRAQIYEAALTLLDSDPEFRYTFCQAAPLQEWIGADAARLERVRRYIREGRLELIGGIMTIPDMNLSSGESIIRNQVMGRDWVEHTLGQPVRMACLEDAFGVPGTLPGLLRACGFDTYKASRMPRPGQPDRSGFFIWEGRDGTRMSVLGCEGMAWGLGESNDIDQPPHTFDQKVEQFRKDIAATPYDGSRPVLFQWMGEEHLPTPKTIEAFKEAARLDGLVWKWSTFGDFLDVVHQWDGIDPQSVREDFSRLFTGCYTTRIDQKRLIFAYEKQLMAELNRTQALAQKGPSPEAWQTLFWAQFHDALGGCHVPENDRWIRRSLRSASRALTRKTSGGDWMNPWPFSWSLPFTVKGKTRSTPGAKKMALQSFDGAWLGVDALEPFEAWRVRPVKVRSMPAESNGLMHGGRDWQLRFGEGAPALDYKGGAVPLPGLLRLREDVGTMWTEDYTGREWREPASFARLEGVETGPVFDRITWSGQLSYSEKLWPGFTELKWRRSLLFFHNFPGLWLRMAFSWRGNSTEISCGCAGGMGAVPRAVGAIPFGWQERPACAPAANTLSGDVFPSPRWAALMDQEGHRTTLVLHSGTPAFRLHGDALENIMLRSPVKRWMPFFPVQPDPTAWDNGDHVMDYCLLPMDHFDGAQAEQLGTAFLSGLVPADPTETPDQRLRDVLKSTPPGVVVSAVTQQAKGWRLHVHEAHGRPVEWSLPGRAEKCNFRGEPTGEQGTLTLHPFEIAGIQL